MEKDCGGWKPESERKIKGRYRRFWLQFLFRIVVLAWVAGLPVLWPEELALLEGMDFFGRFSPLQILWLLWVWYMVEKLLPSVFGQHRGSMKYRRSEFCPTKEYGAQKDAAVWEKWQEQRKWYTKGALSVLAVWILVGAGIFLLYGQGILDDGMLLVTAALFYVSDTVCILIWCPFRHFLMKNRCCTQCRIYNWDTWMMILPLAPIKGFFSYSLLFLAAAAAGIWELGHLLHPERYYALTNASLQCASCKGEPGCYQVRKSRSLWWFLR